MEMSFPEYIENPSGNKNGVWTHRAMYKDMYGQKLTKIIVRETGKVNYTLYYTKDTYTIHFKIPSEVVPKFYYDTVIMFYINDQFISNNNNIRKYNVKFYSNDPAFVFTFAYSFLKNDMFIKDLIPKMSKEAVKKAAVETNPKNEIGYVKSIYFAYLLMDKYNLWSKSTFTMYGEKYDKSKLLSKIENADKKIDDRQKQAEDIRKQNKIEKEKSKNKRKSNPNDVKITNNVNTSSKIMSSIKTKTVGTIKNISNNKNPNFKKF